MNYTLNPDFEIIFKKEKSGELFLKNKYYDNLITMNEIELEMIHSFVNNPDYCMLYEEYSKMYEIDLDFAPQLIQKAMSLDLIISEKYTHKKSIHLKSSYKLIELLKYITFKISTFLLIFNVKIKPEFKGNISFYKFISIDLKDTWVDNLSRNRNFQKAAIWIYFIFLFVSLFYTLSVRPSFNLTEIFNLPQPPLYSVFLILFSGILVSTFLHEFGHFLMYKFYGGITSEMGFALMAGILPVIYTTTQSIYLWDNKKRRIIVALAGIFVDLLLVFITVNICMGTRSPIVLYYSFIFLYIFVVRIFANINPFVPGTDGYFILSDLLSINQLFATSFQSFKITISCFIGFKRILRKDLLYSLYFLISSISLTIYYLLIGFIFIPFIVNFFYKSIGG